MSNLGPCGGAKNAPWSRTSQVNSLINTGNTIQQQIMSQSGMNNLNNNVVPFQQAQVFQNMGVPQQNLTLGLPQISAANSVSNMTAAQISSNQLFQHVNSVTYPNSRVLNASAFQTQQQKPLSNNPSANPANSSSGSTTAVTAATQRVFTGTVTTVHDNFGFVDEDVFFQMSACVGCAIPMVGDRVLVEALYNSRMPFKWNATRIQVLAMTNTSSTRPTKNYTSIQTGYTSTQMTAELDNGNFNRNRLSKLSSGRAQERSRDRDHDGEDVDRKRRREERIREREKEEEKSPLRRRSRSPKIRRRSRIVPRYMVQIPKIALDLKSADVLEVRRRYANLYVPSDFFNSNFRWLDAFPADKPFALNKPCSFHIMSKDAESPFEAEVALEPNDADYLFSAKVMLMSVSGMEDMFQKCCAMAEDKDRRDRESEERDYIHPTRMINFLVGLRGKNETMAIGGPWSQSLDGPNPDKDPAVLIKTAIRTCKALTGIDLANCTKWYRFVELYYRRGDTNHRGKPIAARVETVVIFLPDIWSCLPTRLEWDSLQVNYRKHLERKLRPEHEPDEINTCNEKDEESAEDKLEPTHYSQLDPKVMTLCELRKELKARAVSYNGLKSQLIARLTRALKTEASNDDENIKDEPEDQTDQTEQEESRRGESDDKKTTIDQKERQQLEKRYQLPDLPHIVVHPSKIAKSGKFDCTLMSLSLLLDYRPEDSKEHSFEVSLFAELFNEMLMRDFGFNIYKTLHLLPEKMKKKEEKKRESEKSEKESSKGKDKDEDNKREKNEKSQVNKSDNDTDDEFEEDHEKDNRAKDSKKKRDRERERPKMFTKDRNLLLSFIYFDQTHCGYIFEKDIEDLLHTLGLNLSRAQVRKLVGKVITRDSLHYRKLTDKPKEDDDFVVIDDSEKDVNTEDLAIGNKKLLPIFIDRNRTENGSGSGSGSGSGNGNNAHREEHLHPIENYIGGGMIMFKGALVDVQKLMLQLDRSERARLDSDTVMAELKAENLKLTDSNSKHNVTIEILSNQLNELKEELKVTENSLRKVNAFQNLYQTALVEIKDKVESVLGNRIYDGKKEELSKSRWEKGDETVKMEVDISCINCDESAESTSTTKQ